MLNIKTLRKLLVFWTLFIGIGALWGMIMMLIDPSGIIWGMDPVLKHLQILPFPHIFVTDFIFSGIVLFLANGATQLTTTTLLLKNNKYAARCAIASGIILILWILLQLFVLFGPNPLSITYLIFGLMETLNGILLYRKEKQLDLKSAISHK